MQNSVIFFFFGLLLRIISSPVYWEDFSFSEQQTIIQGLSEQSVLRQYHCRQVSLQDDDETDVLFQELLIPVAEKGLRAFKFHLLNRICMEADGAVAEVVPSVIIRYIYHNADYVLSYLKDHPDLASQYVTDTACELYFITEGVSSSGLSEDSFWEQLRLDVQDKEYVLFFMDNVIKAKKAIGD